MNERLLELYRLSHKPWTVTDPSNNMPIESTYFSAEKFAELIIRECIGLCNEIGEYGEYPKAEAEACAEYISEHFGVKE